MYFKYATTSIFVVNHIIKKRYTLSRKHKKNTGSLSF
uniref:Uncharacterized protein n=1 Tax=uncultured Dokdonia sp. TaxID=575653 RepID=H6RFQ0_9FLAO|nr:hypothetical protein VIS_S18CAA120034 [uncultured Dokdonia sp.]